MHFYHDQVSYFVTLLNTSEMETHIAFYRKTAYQVGHVNL